jgi:hypothetical protein
LNTVPHVARSEAGSSGSMPMRVIGERGLNRVAIHDVPKQEVIDHILRQGHRVEAASPQARYDFTIDGRTRIALRVAFPSSSRRQVQVGGRRYNYVYRAWNFNFHHRGEVGDRYSDFFCCIPLVPEQQVDLAQVFVIPWEAISGKTFYLPDSRRAYAGKFAVYRNAWHLLSSFEEPKSVTA